MKQYPGILVFITVLFLSCNSGKENASLPNAIASEVKFSGAMQNVMKEGKLEANIALDTIEDREGLYGLGPAENLQGELMILNGRSYISRVTSDSTLVVEETYNLKAPFFVYANESRWKAAIVPDSIVTLDALESFIDKKTSMLKKPIVFKLSGIVEEAEIHVQNLHAGAKVTSPAEAHQGQQNYKIRNKEVSIVGFFSRDHQGIFTHNDSFVHMHLITRDKTQMGHLDQVKFKTMKLFLPHGAENSLAIPAL